MSGKWHGVNLRKCALTGCPACKAEIAGQSRRRRQERRDERVLTAGRLIHPNADHGSPSASQYYGCECGRCETAAQRREARRAHKAPGITAATSTTKEAA